LAEWTQSATAGDFLAIGEIFSRAFFNTHAKFFPEGLR